MQFRKLSYKRNFIFVKPVPRSTLFFVPSPKFYSAHFLKIVIIFASQFVVFVMNNFDSVLYILQLLNTSIISFYTGGNEMIGVAMNLNIKIYVIDKKKIDTFRNTKYFSTTVEVTGP